MHAQLIDDHVAREMADITDIMARAGGSSAAAAGGADADGGLDFGGGDGPRAPGPNSLATMHWVRRRATPRVRALLGLLLRRRPVDKPVGTPSTHARLGSR